MAVASILLELPSVIELMLKFVTKGGLSTLILIVVGCTIVSLRVYLAKRRIVYCTVGSLKG